jgi:hypothetical protein
MRYTLVRGQGIQFIFTIIIYTHRPRESPRHINRESPTAATRRGRPGPWGALIGNIYQEFWWAHVERPKIFRIFTLPMSPVSALDASLDQD